MSLEQASYLSQIAGSIAVVVSLIYIGIQLHQNTAQLKRSESNATLSQSSTFRHMIIADRDVAQLWSAGLRNEPLEAVDRLRFESLLTEYTFIALQVWERTKIGLHPGGVTGWRRGHRAGLVRYLTTPGGGAWWAANHARFPAELVAQVEEGFGEGQAGERPGPPSVASENPPNAAEVLTGAGA
ncbi:MAG TPA: hypothetical protein VFE03_09370 [Caulobacteraceae bacterium]|jgi:hypothetical protein|nr:hypothetical protein [Caulobacteraceae bacterium]